MEPVGRISKRHKPMRYFMAVDVFESMRAKDKASCGITSGKDFSVGIPPPRLIPPLFCKEQSDGDLTA